MNESSQQKKLTHKINLLKMRYENTRDVQVRSYFQQYRGSFGKSQTRPASETLKRDIYLLLIFSGDQKNINFKNPKVKLFRSWKQEIDQCNVDEIKDNTVRALKQRKLKRKTHKNQKSKKTQIIQFFFLCRLIQTYK